MSLGTFTIAINLLCLFFAFLLGSFVLSMYRRCQPKFYGLLLWAFFLTLSAAFTYGLYTMILDFLVTMKGGHEEARTALSDLAENMKLLAFVVPGLMLGVAANLITDFLQAPSPKDKSQVLTNRCN